MQKNIRQRVEREEFERSLREDSNPIDDNYYNFDAHMAAEMLRKLVGEKNISFVVPNETSAKQGDEGGSSKNIQDDIPEGYSLSKKYIIQLINSQINFQSDKNPNDSIIMCVERAQLKTFFIVENGSEGDFINGVVKTRTFFGLDNAQFFTSSKGDFSDNFSRILSANHYGSKSNENWPVWVPIESLIGDSRRNCLPFQRIVKRTSARMQYDKFNNLRIKCSDIKKDNSNNDSEGTGLEDLDDFDKRLDLWYIDFPNFKLSATSDQYCILFDAVTDLLMYREPAKKERSEQLNTILLAADLNNLDGAAERVMALQEKIRKLDDIRHQLEFSENFDEFKLEELQIVDVELISAQEELSLLMEAITLSQDKNQTAESKVPLKFVVTADEVTWTMQDSNKHPFCEWALRNTHFIWMTKEENSNMNILEIDHVLVKNTLPSPIFKELICPYITDTRRPVDFSRQKMIRVYWSMMEPVAGIDIVDHFEVNMFPIKFQMQYDVGKLIMMYLFPEKRKTYEVNEVTGENNRNNRPIVKRTSIGSTEQMNKTLKNSSEVIQVIHDEIVSEPQENASEADTIEGSNPIVKRTFSKQSSGHESDKSYELELMKTRASQNRTFVYIKVPSVMHNFSYQVSSNILGSN